MADSAIKIGTIEIAVGNFADGTAGDLITWDAAGEPTTISPGTAGYVLTSNGPGAESTYEPAASGGISWANISGTTQSAAVNTGYVVGNASQTTVTLPATAPLGSIVAVQGKGAGGWILAANTGQTIKIGQETTSSAGTLTSAANYDAIEVVCITADTTWATRFAFSSGITYA